METIITALTTNKLLLLIAVVISAVIVFSVVKKIIKLALICAAVMVLYLAYLVYTGQQVPKTGDEILKRGSDRIEQVKDSGVKAVKKEIRKEINSRTADR